MNTPTELAGRIVAAAVDRFADDNGIARTHLTTEREELSPSDVARATRALGSGVIFDA
jgi:hypothetical protein